MLHFLDIILTILHVLLIAFNMFGWIFPSSRRLHLACILITAGSWFILGIWFGIGYCPITDWQWSVKEQLGERHLPASFITYYANKLSGENLSDSFINVSTLVAFILAAVLSIYFNVKGRKRKHEVM